MAVLVSLERLRLVWRQSPWLVIALGAHVVAFAIISILSWRDFTSTPPDDVISVRATVRDEPRDVPVEPPIERNVVPPDRPRELVTADEAMLEPIELPEVDLTADLGDADPMASIAEAFDPRSSSNIGVGTRGGVRGNPSGYGPSDGEGTVPGRVRRPLAPPAATEEAVLYGFRWLVRHQFEDGHWSPSGLGARCVGDTPCVAPDAAFTDHYDEGVTALALLAFLGAGHGHRSRDLVVDDVRGEKHELGDVVKRGLRWLTQRQREDGSFSARGPFVYSEALCAMALCEAYWLTRERVWKRPAQRALDFLVGAQKRDPRTGAPWGWRYRAPPSVELASASEQELHELADADASVTTWVVMAMKSGELAGLDVPRESMLGGLEFIRWVSRPNGDAGYLSPEHAGQALSGVHDHFAYHPATMSALAMCTRIFAAHDPDDPFLDAAAGRLMRDLPVVSRDRLSIDYYYWYYGSLALHQFDGEGSPRSTGKLWTPWNRALIEALLALQDRRKGRCGHGGWLVPDRWSHTGGPVYATALNVLTLEVYYRYDNAFGVSR